MLLNRNIRNFEALLVIQNGSNFVICFVFLKTIEIRNKKVMFMFMFMYSLF